MKTEETNLSDKRIDSRWAIRPLGRWEFAIGYVENFLRWYAAFRLRDTSILSPDSVSRDGLTELIKARLGVSEGLAGEQERIHS